MYWREEALVVLLELLVTELDTVLEAEVERSADVVVVDSCVFFCFDDWDGQVSLSSQSSSPLPSSLPESISAGAPSSPIVKGGSPGRSNSDPHPSIHPSPLITIPWWGPPQTLQPTKTGKIIPPMRVVVSLVHSSFEANEVE